MAAALPAELAGFEVDAVVGRGSFGTVFRASRAQDGGGVVAVKWVPMGADAVYEGRRLELHANRVLGNELDVLASFWANDTDFRRAVDLVASRKLDVRPLISERSRSTICRTHSGGWSRIAGDMQKSSSIVIRSCVSTCASTPL